MYIGSIAREMPDKTAYLVVSETGQVRESVTYRQLEERSNRLAQLWWNRGLRPGDVVAVCMENNARYLEVIWAAQRSGLLYTAANYRLTSDELAYLVNDCGAAALVVSEATAPSALALLDSSPTVRIRLAVGADLPGHERYEDAVAAAPARPLDNELEGSDLLYSSGTRPGARRASGRRWPCRGRSATAGRCPGSCGCSTGSTRTRSTFRRHRSTTRLRCATASPRPGSAPPWS